MTTANILTSFRYKKAISEVHPSQFVNVFTKTNCPRFCIISIYNKAFESSVVETTLQQNTNKVATKNFKL